MNKKTLTQIDKIFNKCKSLLGEEAWSGIIESLDKDIELHEFADRISSLDKKRKIPRFIPELASLEWAIYATGLSSVNTKKEVKKIKVNPTLEMYELSYSFSEIFNTEGSTDKKNIKKKKETVLLWKNPKTGKVEIKEISGEDVIALKIAIENMNIKDVAKENGLLANSIEDILFEKKDKGIIFMPDSKIVRDSSFCKNFKSTPKDWLVADFFTIQWHITNACDLSCKHCYDRNKRSPLTLEQGKKVLDDLDEFCDKKQVRGHVCFSGGNPFLSPHFFDLYKEASDRGYSISILGNPTEKKELEKILAIQKPTYFQVSLEGLEKHNDYIRGEGFYKKVIEFLGILKEAGISSAVMLTLTKDNIDEVLPLAEKLKNHSDYFTFNRLSNVGEGKNLLLPKKGEYAKFLREYVNSSEENPIIGFKDNLINIVLEEEGSKPFGGCTGYGCGAAFSFVTILPDGEVHACRKFPSLLGNISDQNLLEIYNSKKAAKYRLGSEACFDCSLKPYCGGCLAVTSGQKEDIFKNKDPFCFK